MNIKELIKQKTVTAEEAVSHLKNGSRVFIGSSCGEPKQLIEAMINDFSINDIMIYQMLAMTLENYLLHEYFTNRFSLKLFFVTYPMRQPQFEGKFDFIPTYLSEVPQLFRSNQIGLDAALIHISPPDPFGYASLGISVDVTREAARSADLVIAQVNPAMPRTHGDGFIHINDIDYLVPTTDELLEAAPIATDEWVTRRIGKYVSELVDDGSTIQVGYGYIPYSILQFLDEKNDLGIHTQMITEAFIPLHENGNVTNAKKNFFKDRSLAALCMGKKIIYEYVDNNPAFYFGTTDFVNNPRIIAQNDNFISICEASQVDLTGQVCSDRSPQAYFSGTGDQVNFIRAASMSKGGFSIIALPSTDAETGESNIVPRIDAGAGLATIRSDVNFVVTEYGIAQLKGKSIYQRVIELTQIAHPDFRQQLIDQAKENRYIFNDQLPPRSEDLIFIEDYKYRICLRNKKLLSVRPLLPSDEIAYRNFYYSLKQETVFLRFFHNIDVFSHRMAQAHWANLDYRNNVTLIGLVRNRGNKEIIAVGTYAGLEDGEAEVAFVVQEDFQGLGIATILLEKLEEIAKENGCKKFTATVLRSNPSMKHIFLKRYPKAKVIENTDDLEIIMDFYPTEDPQTEAS